MRHDHEVAAGWRRCGDELAKRLGSPIVFRRRHHEAALADIGRGLDLTVAQQRAGIDRALEHAGLNFADGNPEFVHGLTDRFGERTAVVVELALLGNVLRIERIGVGLV